MLFQDGCWSCFDEVQLLHKEALSILLHHVQAVFNAVKTKQDYVILGDNLEVWHKNLSSHVSENLFLSLVKLPVKVKFTHGLSLRICCYF